MLVALETIELYCKFVLYLHKTNIIELANCIFSYIHCRLSVLFHLQCTGLIWVDIFFEMCSYCITAAYFSGYINQE